MADVKHILIIDDNANFRDVLRVRLQSAGYAISTASSGREGIDATKTQAFDLILLDMLMPGQDGVATYQELRANPKTQQLPIILLTAAAVEGYWQPMPYEPEGRAFVMGKPYEPQTLLARIDQILTHTSGQNE